jgi:hypothetical protein
LQEPLTRYRQNIFLLEGLRPTSLVRLTGRSRCAPLSSTVEGANDKLFLTPAAPVPAGTKNESSRKRRSRLQRKSDLVLEPEGFAMDRSVEPCRPGTASVSQLEKVISKVRSRTARLPHRKRKGCQDCPIPSPSTIDLTRRCGACCCRRPPSTTTLFHVQCDVGFCELRAGNLL